MTTTMEETHNALNNDKWYVEREKEKATIKFWLECSRLSIRYFKSGFKMSIFFSKFDDQPIDK